MCWLLNYSVITLILLMESLAFFNPSLNTVEVTYKGFVRTDNFIEHAKQHIEELKNRKSISTLIDVYEMKVLSKEAQSYINKTWFSEVKKNGLKYVAFVVPESIFGQLSMQTANKDVTEGLVIKYFLSRSEAETWIESIN